MSDRFGKSYTGLEALSMADARRSRIWFDLVRARAQAHGSVVLAEVGVGQGGRLALAGLAIAEFGAQGSLFGFDTFDDPYSAGDEDKQDPDLKSKLLSEQKLMSDKFGFEPSQQVWLALVRQNVNDSGYTVDINLVAGKA